MGKKIEIEDQMIERLKEFRKPGETELKARLTELQYRVTQEEGTERPFENKYWESKEHGIYVDLLSGEPLFSSTHKFDSKTGWPSFFAPIHEELIVQSDDMKLFTRRVEVKSRYGNNHLGHLFNDGPQPTGLRYCVNSAALKFVPKERLDEEGYGRYNCLFDE